jgi:hypothetical protein
LGNEFSRLELLRLLHLIELPEEFLNLIASMPFTGEWHVGRCRQFPFDIVRAKVQYGCNIAVPELLISLFHQVCIVLFAHDASNRFAMMEETASA